MLGKDNTLLYLVFQIIYLGAPSRLLDHLWFAYDRHHSSPPGNTAWPEFHATMMESYRSYGVMVSPCIIAYTLQRRLPSDSLQSALIASADGALLAISASENSAVYALLLSSLTASVICLSATTSLLSTASSMDPALLERIWSSYGIVFVILLCAPSAWIRVSLWTLEAGLLAIVWTSSLISVKVVVTAFIGFSILIDISIQVAVGGISSILGLRSSSGHKTFRPPNSELYRELATLTHLFTLAARVTSREEHIHGPQVNIETDQRAMQLMAQGRGSHVVYELSED
jgi:hypothetical protein